MTTNAILVSSHPRSGTHLFLDTLRRQFPTTNGWRWFGLPLDHLYLNLERLGSENRRFDAELASDILQRAPRPLMKTHFLADFSESWSPQESRPPAPPFKEIVASARSIYVVRHPMSVLSSYLQFLSALHPELRQISLEEFLFSQHWSGKTDRLGWWIAHVEGWRANPGTLVLRYEDLIDAPEQSLDLIAAHIGQTARWRLPYLPQKVTSVTLTRLHRLTRLSPPSTAIIADRKRYPKASWRKVLSEETVLSVHKRCSTLLSDLGYSLSNEEQVVK